MPTVEHVGVSRKITDEDERRRLKTVLKEFRQERGGGGLIARTAGQGREAEAFLRDGRYLSRTWDEVRALAARQRAPVLLYREPSLARAAAARPALGRRRLDPARQRARVPAHARARARARAGARAAGAAARRARRASSRSTASPPSSSARCARRSGCPSGGYIVINQTEALVAIDVNTGRFVGKNQLEETLLKANLDAVREIVRQIRLRDLGGIIVVDFIDMEERKSRREVMRALEQELRRDRSPTKLLSVNEFGLVILTRKRVKQSLERLLMQPCPYCSGSGQVKSVATVCSEIYDEVRKLAADMRGQRLVLRVNPEVARALGGDEAPVLKSLAEPGRRRGHASRPTRSCTRSSSTWWRCERRPAGRDEGLVAYVEAIEAVAARAPRREHVLSPRDFALARGWHEAGVPLATVLVAIDLAFERDPHDRQPRRVPRAASRSWRRSARPGAPAARETERASLPEVAERLAALRERLLAAARAGRRPAARRARGGGRPRGRGLAAQLGLPARAPAPHRRAGGRGRGRGPAPGTPRRCGRRPSARPSATAAGSTTRALEEARERLLAPARPREAAAAAGVSTRRARRGPRACRGRRRRLESGRPPRAAAVAASAVPVPRSEMRPPAPTTRCQGTGRPHRGQRAQGPSHGARAARHAEQRGDLAVGGDPAPRDRPDQCVDAQRRSGSASRLTERAGSLPARVRGWNRPGHLLRGGLRRRDDLVVAAGGGAGPGPPAS